MAIEKKVSLSEIKCEKIASNIKEATSLIFKFTNILNKCFNQERLKKPRIYIIRTDIDTFEDDGYTKTPGYKYDVYWLYNYIKSDDNISYFKLQHFETYMWPTCMLCFKLTIRERVSDNMYKGGRFFQIYLTEETTPKRNEVTIESYNDNYELSSILDLENLYECIEKIDKVYERIARKQRLTEEL